MIIGISGRKQSGKTTVMNYIHGYLMKQNLVVEDFSIDDNGELKVTALMKDENGNMRKDMGIFRLNQRSSTFEAYMSQRVWPVVKGYNLADSLKDVCMGLLGLTFEQCYGTDEEKNSLTNLRWENMPGVTTIPPYEGPYTTQAKMSDWITNTSGINKYHEAGQMTAREVLQYVGTDMFRKMYDNIWIDALFSQIQSDGAELALIGDCRFTNEVEAVKSAGGLMIRLLRNPYNDTHASEKDLDNYSDWDLVIDNREKSIKECHMELLRFLLDRNIVKPLGVW